ncbi:MAG: hypothetical protein HC869_14900 [Rhodospirillales bacterium]|nr:hypothetical protein [Rhodospirillales bacterium]
MESVALRVDEGLDLPAPMASRKEVLARYRRLREIGKQHHSAVMSFLSQDAILQQGRRLGLASGRTFLLDSMDELTLVFDLAIHTAPAGRSRAIDRYARSTRFPEGSDEAVSLDATRKARFAILTVQDRHPVAGLLVSDSVRGTDLWLMDEGLEQSLSGGDIFATRYYQPAEFAMTAGVIIPMDLALLEAAILSLPQLGDVSLVEVLDDRRFAEALCREALADGIMEKVAYRDPTPPDDPRSAGVREKRR